ncbi:hypothetical protein ACWGQ6_38855, partial [Streptomyces niveus]
MRIHVEDAPSASSDINSGLGVRAQSGKIDIVNGSEVYGANVGAMLWGFNSAGGRVGLTVDNSILQSGRGAAIQVMPLTATDYDIAVRNNSRLVSGDGNLLLVGYRSPANPRTDVNFTVDDSRLAGNVTFDPTTVTNGSLDVVLRNKAQIDGRFNNVTTADIGSESTWLMTGDSTVGALTLGATGTVALGNGSTFNT